MKDAKQRQDIRQRMAQDMKLRGLAPRTRERYLHAIKVFYSPEIEPGYKVVVVV